MWTFNFWWFFLLVKRAFKGSLSSLLDFADFVSFSAKTTQDKNWVLEANFKYFLTRENSRKSWNIELSNFWKKKIFQALAKSKFEKKIKIFEKMKKNAFFLFHVYGSKMAKKDFFCMKLVSCKSSKYFETFWFKKFFHTAIPFGCRSAWNFGQKWWKLDFFQFHVYGFNTYEKTSWTKKFQNTLNFCMKPVSFKKNSFLAILEP